jgi:hypothetical protein
MQLNNAQDQSTQAMTEVALALSMAFFSLLLVALISIGVPGTVNEQQRKALSVPEFVLTETRPAGKNTKAINQPKEIQYIFYFDSKFYDQHLKKINVTTLNNMQKLVIAMPMETDVSKALALQKKFKGFDLALTIMDREWLVAFENSMKYQ